MLSDFTGSDKVYIACGYTDLRRGIDGLAALVRQLPVAAKGKRGKKPDAPAVLLAHGGLER